VEMIFRRSAIVVKVLLFLLISYIYVFSGCSTVSISCNYYNDDGEISEDASVDNAVFEGKVTILPYQFQGRSIFSEERGHTYDVHCYSELDHKITATNGETTNGLQVNLKSENARYTWRNKGLISPDNADLSCASSGTISPGDSSGGSDLSEASSLLRVTSLGKTVTAESALWARSGTPLVASTEWGVEANLGTQESMLNQYTNIRSHPGYLTFPTAQQVGLISTGMTLEGQYVDGEPLFTKRYVPIPIDEEHNETNGFGFPLILGVMEVEDDNVYMENKLAMSMKWQRDGWDTPGDGA